MPTKTWCAEKLLPTRIRHGWPIYIYGPIVTFRQRRYNLRSCCISSQSCMGMYERELPLAGGRESNTVALYSALRSDLFAVVNHSWHAAKATRRALVNVSYLFCTAINANKRGKLKNKAIKKHRALLKGQATRLYHRQHTVKSSPKPAHPDQPTHLICAVDDDVLP